MSGFAATPVAIDSTEDEPVPEPGYIAVALTVAVGITGALRAVPFGLKNAMKESALLADVGRWMPLGAIAILAVYFLSAIDVTEPPSALSELVGVAPQRTEFRS